MELEEAIKKLKTLNQEKYKQDTILSLYSNFIDEDDENQPYILTPFERDAIEVVLNHLTKQEKMIDKMADEILELNNMIVQKEELFSVVPIWLGKEHIIEYFKGITNKKD